MAQITLARALKLKNRLNGRFAATSTEISTYNSQAVHVTAAPQPGVVPPKTEVDVAALFERREALRDAIVALKLLINTTNGPITGDIYQIAELKGDITFYSGLRTNNVFQPNGHLNGGGTQYVAFKKKADVDAIKKKLETQIDALQEKIDKHNHKTLIEVEDIILSLAS